jgi:hypothetical protein
VRAASVVAASSARNFLLFEQVIQSEPISSLFMRQFQKPWAGMGSSGSGPHLKSELSGSQQAAIFPNPDLFDYIAVWVIRCLDNMGR